MKGKEKCKILKEIRAEIARANDIEWVTENCTHKGDCRGTCPKCESEVAALERALARRKALGKTVAVVGLSAGIIAASTSCEAIEEYMGPSVAGAMTTPPPSQTYPVTGDIEFELTIGEAPAAPIYYISDFERYEIPKLMLASDSLPLYTVEQDSKQEEEIASDIPKGDGFSLLGEYESENMSLILYKGIYYAVDSTQLQASAHENLPVDD